MLTYIKNKINKTVSILKRYNIFYLANCILKKISLSFILNKNNQLINRGDYFLFWKNEPFLNSLFVNPKMVREDEMFIKTFLKEDDTYIDIGANIGTTTIRASKSVGVKGTVFAFEPHIETYLFLKKNLSLNNIKNVKVYNLALGDREEKLFITDKAASDANHLVKEGDISVDVKTLDSVVPDVKEINLLKIDTEGFEEAVFKGAQKTLEKTKIVFFESLKSQYDRYGFSFKTIFELLKSKNFNIYKLSFEKDGVHFEEIIKPDYISDNCENICASKDKMPTYKAF